MLMERIVGTTTAQVRTARACWAALATSLPSYCVARTVDGVSGRQAAGVQGGGDVRLPARAQLVQPFAVACSKGEEEARMI